ncbi:flagellar hook-associated protein FlgK [Rivihabitans pingtungensis]|uniref:Flagellar hook-associated protein 1 n=2 Tax=Rivihabitans pingtungensis TaxID=1054498 RepID=A0A318KZP8_9NEIS|nr:flagellar hook-associated protein FlgK [Rivihabitans pingtungensis]PXX78743.1 flagellar hook-associated protein 1 FlgK [Rivihabitans pingtungensis]
MSSIFGIAVSGLNAARASLTTTSHNISGLNTAGYHRQVNGQASNMANYTGAGYIGNGVQTTSISRVYDSHLEKVVQSNTAMESYYSTQEAQLDQLDGIIADPTVGITPALQSFFESLQVLTQPNMPASIPSRQAVVNQAQALVTRMQTMDARIEEIREGVNTGIRLTVDNINAQANKIAELNKQIQQLSLGDQIVPNDLLDARDQAVLELNKSVKATVVKQDGNVYNVFIGSGQSLVLGEIPMQLAATPSRDDPQRYAVSYKENNMLFEIPGTQIDGGSLGGLLNFRHDALDVAQNALNRIAIGFAQSMNAQHLLGVDVNGVPVASKVSSQQEFFAIKSFAADLRVPANSNNTGTLKLQASVISYIPGSTNLTGYSQMTNNDYKFICTSPGNFSIQRQPDNALMSPTDLNGTALGTTITSAQLAAGIVLDGVKVELNNPLPTATLTAATGAGTGAGMPATAASAAAEAMAAVLAEAASPAGATAIAAAEKAGYAAAAAKGHTMTAAQMTAVSTSLSGSIAATRAAAPGTSFAGDSFMLQPTRGAIAQMSVNVTQPSEVAASANVIGKPVAGNTGSASIASAWQNPVNSKNMVPMQPSVGLQYVAGAWTVTTPAAGFKVILNPEAAGGYKVVTTAGEDAGISFKVDGTPNNNDSFTLRLKTTAEFGVSDSFNMLQMTNIQTQNTMEGSGGGKPNTSFVGSYSRMVSMVANKTAEAQAAGEAATASLKEATLTRESVSGVNLDEEAANLLRFQQAYLASSKCIEIANTLFDSILNAVN